jgi:hypothetical protein
MLFFLYGSCLWRQSGFNYYGEFFDYTSKPLWKIKIDDRGRLFLSVIKLRSYRPSHSDYFNVCGGCDSEGENGNSLSAAKRYCFQF